MSPHNSSEFDDDSQDSQISIRHEEDGDDNSISETKTEIITLFGINGSVGTQFVKLALSAGYHIRALSTSKMDFQHECLTVVDGGDLDSIKDEVLAQLLHEATYCVCLMSSDTALSKRKDYPPGLICTFVQRLYPLMNTCSTIRLFLYQASSTSIDTKTKQAPVLATVVKFVKRCPFLKDQDAVVKLIGDNASVANFHYIVTRPGIVRNGPAKKRLAASKSQPLVPITTMDLAEFTLSALRMQKLYNKCPYVVGDGLV